MKEQLLQQAEQAQATAGLSARRLCRAAGWSRATCQRWRRRRRQGQPLCRRPGVRPVGPLPLAQVRAQLEALDHGAHRTRGTGAIFREHRAGISRREFAGLVTEVRHEQRRTRREALRQITWFTTQTAWAMDATEWATGAAGVKLQVLVTRDLASNYGLGLQGQAHLSGEQVAEYLALLIRRYGAPLFLKRDNGAVLHTPAVEQVLAEAAVLPLDSPVRYPRYNGGIEKHIGDVKRQFPYPLPPEGAVPVPAQLLMESLLHEANARPREALDGVSPAEMYFNGPELHVDRATRAAIFQSLLEATGATVKAMNQTDPRRFASAWRQHAEQWLCDQGLIAITKSKPTNDQNQLLLPLFLGKWSH